MLFNSIDFAIFFPIVFFAYWFLGKKSLVRQNLIIVIASYIFYGWWDWRFLFLIVLSSIIDYSIGYLLGKTYTKQKRKWFLAISLVSNLGILMFFKYFNFFIENFTEVFSFLGYEIPSTSLNVILPVGISFYTFQTMSYTIDVYRGKLKPTKDFIAFAAFVSFFPQLVAGPIERATNLLPQFYRHRTFNYDFAVDGLRQMLWGFFKKMVIADNCAIYANQIFNNSDDASGSSLALGALFFTFQIYGDFSGYSDIAIGLSKIFGFDLMKNFSFPYFSRDIAEFWRRWHISLSTWFRDYLYIPLGGSKGGNWMRIRNTFIIFIVSGFWHGANWTFIVWGFLNALYILPSIIFKTNRKNLNIVAENRLLPNLKEILQMGITFTLTVFAWIFFRAESIKHAFSYIDGLFSLSLFKPLSIKLEGLTSIVLIILFFMSVEWLGRRNNYAIEKLGLKYPSIFRYLFYYGIIVLIICFTPSEKQEFIYFQF